MKKNKVAKINVEMSELLNYHKNGVLPPSLYGDSYFIDDEFTIKEIYDDMLIELFKEK